MAHLAGRVALVLGAGSSGPGWGNGKAAAVAYARAGSSIACVDLSPSAAAATAAIIADEGGDAIALAADVTIAAEVEAAVSAARERFGRIDILHNNVGIGDFGNPVEMPEALWDRIIDVNLKSVFLSCKYVLPLMERQGGGVITNISSIAGAAIGGYPMIAYYASKAGLNHMTRAIAVAYAARKIRCNAIMPGLINTPMATGSPDMRAHYGGLEALIAARDAQSPTGKMGQPWDVAALAVFLAGDEAGYINGQVIAVDGGLGCRIG